MKRIAWVFFAVVVIATVLLLLRLLGPRIEAESTLLVDLSGSYSEAPSGSLPAKLLGVDAPSFLAVLGTLRKAERDERIAHVVIRIRGLQVGWAKAEEFRAAIHALRKAGRHPVALVEVPGFGGNLAYFVGSAAEEVYLTPGSGAPLVGLGQEHFFLGGLWEHAGVDLEVFQAGVYKSAVENLSDREMSAAYKEQAESLLSSIDEHFVGAIAADRGLAVEVLRSAIDEASSIPERLESLGLIDGVATQQSLLESLGDGEVVDTGRYAEVDLDELGIDPEGQIALVYASGAIMSGSGTSGPTGSPVVAADTLVEAIEQAADDEATGAIVLRIDSPGGAPGPSELIWQAVRRAREKKPVIASFSDYAASGGYYIGSAADAVVASAATVTGSIGVFGVRPSLGDLLERFGVRAYTSKRAANGDLMAVSKPLSPESHAWVEANIREVYRLFLKRVAEGRERDVESVREVAEGRVWTGEQAVERDLVDSIGGFREAVRLAKERAGLDPERDALLVVFPEPAPLSEQIRQALGLRIAALGADAVRVPNLGAFPGELATWLAAVAEGPALVAPFWIDVR